MVSGSGVTKLEQSYLDHCQWSAWNDGFQIFAPMNVTNVVVHVESVQMAQTFDVLVWTDTVLNVLIVATTEHRIVDKDSVNGIIVVGLDDGILQ